MTQFCKLYMSVHVSLKPSSSCNSYWIDSRIKLEHLVPLIMEHLIARLLEKKEVNLSTYLGYIKVILVITTLIDYNSTPTKPTNIVTGAPLQHPVP